MLSLAQGMTVIQQHTSEVRAVIIAAWQRGGLLPAATIDQMVPERIDGKAEMSR